MDAFCILNLTTGPVTELSIIRCIYCAYSFKIPAYAVDLCSLLSFYIYQVSIEEEIYYLVVHV